MAALTSLRHAHQRTGRYTTLLDATGGLSLSAPESAVAPSGLYLGLIAGGASTRTIRTSKLCSATRTYALTTPASDRDRPSACQHRYYTARAVMVGPVLGYLDALCLSVSMLYVQRDTEPDLGCAEQRDVRMNVMALITGVAGAVYGGIAVWLVVLRRRPWTAAGLIAVGFGWLITLATEDNRSRAEHKAVWLASCVLWAFFLVCLVMDARGRRMGKLPDGPQQ